MWRAAVIGGMASYLDASTIVAASIGFVLYAQGGMLVGEKELGLLSALLTLGLAVGAVVGGRFGDLFGRRRVLFLDLLLFSVGLGLLTFAPSVEWLISGSVIAGLAMGADLPVSLALVAEQGRFGQRGRLVGVTNLLWLAGIAGVIVVSSAVTVLGVPPTLGARVMFGHLLVIALAVWGLRLSIGESAIWREARNDLHRVSAAGVPGSPSVRTLWQWRWPLISIGLMYLLWNLQANTSGQFNAYLFVVAGGTLGQFNVAGLAAIAVGLGVSYFTLRLLDGRRRRVAYLGAGLLGTGLLLLPAMGGITVATMLPLLVAPPALALLSTESFYKIWSQECIPTLIRSTAQGVTIFVARLGAALFALITPTLVRLNPQGLFWLLVAASAGSLLIGWFSVSRLPPTDH